MRYLTVRLRASDGGAFHPVGERLAADPAIRREAIHHVELLDDGTVVTLAEGSGDCERYETLMAESPSVEDFLVSGDERWMATSQFTAHDRIRAVLEQRRDADIVVDMPITVNEDGSLRVTFLGTDEAFRTMFENAGRSAAMDMEVVETGDYQPDAESFVAPLTDRQREVLETAVEVGYYEDPRAATQADVADAVGLAPSTVGTHLRKVEARVFRALVR